MKCEDSNKYNFIFLSHKAFDNIRVVAWQKDAREASKYGWRFLWCGNVDSPLPDLKRDLKTGECFDISLQLAKQIIPKEFFIMREK